MAASAALLSTHLLILKASRGSGFLAPADLFHIYENGSAAFFGWAFLRMGVGRLESSIVLGPIRCL
jgi:hypothetical protein